MVRPIEQLPIHTSLKVVIVLVARKVLMEVNKNISLHVGNLLGISDQHLRPQPIHWLNIIIAFELKIYIMLHIIQYFNYLKH